MPAPSIGVKVVHDVAAADDEDAFLSERRELLPDLKVKRGRLGLVDAELDDGNIRRGIDVFQYGPCAVIEPPRVVELHVEWHQQFLHSARQHRIAGRRVLHLKKFLRKAAEVVNRPGRRRDSDDGLGDVPVRGDRKDRFGLRCLLADPTPRLRVRIAADRVHRIAVAEENRWRQTDHGPSLSSAYSTPIWR